MGILERQWLKNLLAQAAPQDSLGQEESHASKKRDRFQDICKLHHP